MEEEWVTIEDWPEYLISNLGRVYSIRTDIMLKPGLAGKGYAFVILSARGKKKQIYVHHLVGFVFIDGYFEGAEINHKNGIKTDNVFWNLEWSTHVNNMRHCFTSGLNPNAGRDRTPIRIIETGEVFVSQRECADHIGGRQSTIAACLSGRLKQHKGYTFEYAD